MKRKATIPSRPDRPVELNQLPGRFVRRREPPDSSRVWLTHGPPFLAAASLLSLARFIPLNRVGYEVCTLKRWTDWPCPSCGATRTFVAAAHGQWREAFFTSPLALGLFLGVLVIMIWNLAAMIRREIWTAGSWLRPPHVTWKRIFIWGIPVVLFNYLYRLSTGMDGG